MPKPKRTLAEAMRMVDVSTPILSQVTVPTERRSSLPIVRLVREGRTTTTDGTIRTPADAEPILREMLQGATEERFIAVHLNTRHRPIAYQEVSRGSISASIVHPREVFRAAIVNGTSALILAHNHPSGDPSPSEEDLDITQRLRRTGELVGIEVLDHLILGEGKAFSMREAGLL